MGGADIPDDDEYIEDDEDDLGIELVQRLTQFYQDAMVEVGLTEAQRKDVTMKVMLKQIQDMQNEQRMMDEEEDVD